MDNPAKTRNPDAFAIKDCALIAIAAGISARDASQLRHAVSRAPADSIYYHFWGSRLRPTFDDPEFVNDFASWAARSLHDKPLAERLSVVDPTALDDLEALRREVVDVLDESLDASERLHYLQADQDFAFIRSQLIIFDTGGRVADPSGLARAVRKMSLGSLFYHFIDARRRIPDRVDDFSAWVSGFGSGCDRIVADIAAVDPYFTSLAELRARLVSVLEPHSRQSSKGKGKGGGKGKK